MLADVLGLVGSSPTPGASDVGSTTKRNKNKQREFVLKTKSNRYMILQKSQIEENNNNNNLYSSSSSNTEEELERKIDSIQKMQKQILVNGKEDLKQKKRLSV